MRRLAPAGLTTRVRRAVLIGFILGVPLLVIGTAEALRAHPPGLRLLEAGSALAGLLGVALLPAMRIAGWAAQRRRSVYLWWARSGPRTAAAGVVVLTVLHAAVVVAAIWFASVSVGITFGAAIVAAGFVTAMARRLASLVRPPGMTLIANRLGREQGARMYQRVEQLAEYLGALPPRQIVVGLEGGCFTTDAKLDGTDGTHTGRTFYCALPLVRVISLSEFDALAGHELRHPTMPSARAGASSDSLAFLPALLILDYLDEAFALAEHRDTRDREVAADRDAARVAGPLDVASAFLKAHTMAELWDRIQAAAPNPFGQERSAKNISKAAAELAVTQGSFLPVDFPDPASSLIEGVETLEEGLSERYGFHLEKLAEPQRRALPRRTALLIVIALLTLSRREPDNRRVDPCDRSEWVRSGA